MGFVFGVFFFLFFSLCLFCRGGLCFFFVCVVFCGEVEWAVRCGGLLFCGEGGFFFGWLLFWGFFCFGVCFCGVCVGVFLAQIVNPIFSLRRSSALNHPYLSSLPLLRHLPPPIPKPLDFTISSLPPLFYENIISYLSPAKRSLLRTRRFLLVRCPHISHIPLLRLL